jgi:hypothetical protein
MQENVGRLDQTARAFLGPALITIGVAGLGAGRSRLAGLAAVIAGTLLTESAITRTCPTNYLLGIDTREIEEELTS